MLFMEATTTTEVPKGSAFGRMFNVLAAPGEVFAEIKDQPVAHSNWWVPAIVWAIIGFITAMLLFSQEWAINDIVKAQENVMQKQVEAQKMTQAQADQAVEAMRKFMPVVMKFMGGIGSLVMAFAVAFIWGFIIWLLANKVFDADIEYMKAVEAAGLSTIIYLLAGVLSTLVSFVLGRIATISPGLFVTDFDMANRAHLALAALNPFYLWFASVIAVSVSVLASAPLGKSLLWTGVVWGGVAGCVPV